MKKIFFLIILLCFATSHAQEIKPTKQETMDWIGNKYGELLASPRKFISNKDGILAYKNKGVTVYLDFNKVTSYEFKEHYGGGVCDSGCDNIKLFGENLVKYSSAAPTENAFYEVEGVREIFNPDSANWTLNGISQIAGLRDRLEKAIKALVDYNTSKKDNEAY